MSQKTSELERLCLDAIRDFRSANGFPPSVREVACKIGRCHGTVSKLLVLMKERGLVTWEPLKKRTLVVIGDYP